MRVEPHGVGSVLHVVKRGARGGLIVRDKEDKEHFLRALYYLNDTHHDPNWISAIAELPIFERPAHWPEQEPLASVVAWTLMPNHFHIIFQEIRNGGVAKLMQRLCGSMSARFNAKYKESGSLFQGSYRARVVSNDADLRWLASYVMVKNTFELYPGGLIRAEHEFEKAWKWALRYPYSTMGGYAQASCAPDIDRKGPLEQFIRQPAYFKKESRDMLASFVERRSAEGRKALMLEK